jgi:hypothetical protein
MWLTGDSDGPPLAPAGDLPERLIADVGTDLVADPMAVLGERAALARKLRRRGRTSCGEVTRLLPAGDGWVALCLARPDDQALVPALVEGEVTGDPWDAVARWAAPRPPEEVVERTTLLGLPASRLGETPSPSARACPPQGLTGARRTMEGRVVVDLSSLWAGPLATSLLAGQGARVVKVESRERPDGARRGARRFYALLHGGTEAVALRFSTERGRGQLHQLLDAADVVVLAARQRAVAQLGIDVDALLRSRSDKVVALVTAHGWASERVGFGDDAAVAGGLVAWGDDGTPRFAADAIADPLTGMVAARRIADAVGCGGQHRIEVALAEIAASWAGPREPAATIVDVARPRARPIAGPAPRLGADNRAWLR